MDNQSKLPSPPDAFVVPLLELRDYYGLLAEDYEKLYRQALTNFNHVEALLSVWSDNAKLSTLEKTSKPVPSNLENLPLENNDFTPEPKVNLADPINSQLSATPNLSSAKEHYLMAVLHPLQHHLNFDL